MQNEDCQARLILAAKEQEHRKKNWFNSLQGKHQKEIESAAKQVAATGITYLSLAKVVKSTFKINRSHAHIARVLKELANVK